jgi:hypothetical protein
MPAVMHRVALAGERRLRARRWLALPEEHEEEARRGYKAAQVLVTEDGTAATLSGITLGGSYLAEDVARCGRPGCAPPSLSCACGFYAFKSRAEAVALVRETLACNGLRHKALLTVELDGTVLEYERGYRGERQRVMGVAFERSCTACEQEGNVGRATTLAASRQYHLSPFARSLPTSRPPAASMVPVRPVCDRHVPPGGQALSLPELAGLLGTEVSWLGWLP